MDLILLNYLSDDSCSLSEAENDQLNSEIHNSVLENDNNDFVNSVRDEILSVAQNINVESLK